MIDSPCSRTDPEAMFPKADDTDGIAFAKRTCGECFARTECLEWAIAPASRANFGVWGGLTETERRTLIRQQQRGRADRIDYGPLPPKKQRFTAAA
ncbi:WhiB family transcriptional regulator [Streptomyces sp. NPDC050508]|uniref:WhiB family transcriptional regulator n=1 Tax=Streptomyces sp. NPDC050508 TaxID=3155405 RepID=UPI003421BE99